MSKHLPLLVREMGRPIPPRSVAEYRARAYYCLGAAKRAKDFWVQIELISLAAHWTNLADLVENAVLRDEAFEWPSASRQPRSPV